TEPPRRFDAITAYGVYLYAGGTFAPWGYADARTSFDALKEPKRGSSYGMNGWLVPPPPGAGRYTGPSDLCVRVGPKDSSLVPLLADSKYPVPTPLPTDPPYFASG